MSTHQIVAVTPKPASQQGALDGHEAICSCGYRMGTSLSALQAQMDGAEHVRYMERKARKG